MIPYRLPAITAPDTQGQLRQLKSYLYQLVETLNAQQQGQPAAAAPAPAPAVQSPGQVFAGIKGLILQSAEIVEKYYEQMEKKFSGSYVASSAFGTYREETSQALRENAAAAERSFQSIQQVTTRMDGIEGILIGVNAYINSGLLYYEAGVPVYGIEVGQRTQQDGQEVFRKYARFTANKLSFYDHNDNEVAYISDYKLGITNVEVSGVYRAGQLVDTVLEDGSVVTKYAGGGT